MNLVLKLYKMNEKYSKNANKILTYQPPNLNLFLSPRKGNTNMKKKKTEIDMSMSMVLVQVKRKHGKVLRRHVS